MTETATAPKFTVETARALYEKANAAGRAAGEAARPVPMVVGSPSTPLGSDVDPTKKMWYVADGVCGFAWVSFAGNTSFGRAAKKAGFARSAYGGGLSVWVSGFGQSMQRKEAYADAFAAVLREAGVKAYAESRMD